MSYNATVYSTHKQHGAWGTFVAQVEEIGGRLQMLRSNSAQCTGMEDKVINSWNHGDEDLAEKYPAPAAAYDVYLRESNPDIEYRIVVDNCEGYRNRLAGLALPLTYR